MARDKGEPREQQLVLVGEWIGEEDTPADPLTEFFVRYIDGHGPASPEDFAWWAGLPKGQARAAAARADTRVVEIEPGRFALANIARRTLAAPTVHALPSFEEFYIGYADRSPVAGEQIRTIIGPAKNGMVSPILISGGEVIGRWRPPLPAQRATGEPEFELFALVGDAVSPTSVAAALERAMDVLRN